MFDNEWRGSLQWGSLLIIMIIANIIKAFGNIVRYNMLC